MKWYIRPIWESNRFGQAFGIFVEEGYPLTTHFCSNAWYAEWDLLRHEEAKQFDIIYGLRWDVVYINRQISDEAKQRFNDSENAWWQSKYWIRAPSNHLIE